MARIPLDIGEWGAIKRIVTPRGHAARANFRDGRGVRVSVQRSGASGAQAERNLIHSLRELSKIATGDGEITPETTVEELAEYYFGEIVDDGAKDGTITTYRSNYSRYILPAIGKVKLRQITVARLQQIIRAQKDKPATAKGIRVVLVNMFDVAVRHDALRVNLASNTKPVAIARKRVEALSPDRVKGMIHMFSLASQVHGRDMDAPLKVLAVTGCRTGELLAIRWQDLDEKTGVLRVTGTIVQDAATGALKRQEEGKTAAAERGITLPGPVVAMLIARHETSEGEAMFPDRNGGYQWPNNFRRKWRAITDGTKFEGVTPRDFRKAVATYLDRRIGSKAAQLQLGHESDQVTTKFYIERADQVADFSTYLQELVSD